MSEGSESSLPPPEPLTAEDAAPVLRRLETIIEGYLSGAPKVGVRISPAQVLLVVDQAILQAEGRVERAGFDDSIEGWFLSGLFDELVDQQYQIFDTVVERGQTRHVPIRAETWAVCLRMFRSALLRDLKN